MKVIIFGATGTIGQILVKEMLIKGHQVTACARNPFTLPIDQKQLTLRAVNVLDHLAVDDVIKGHDAVIIALGAGMKGMVRSEGTKNIIKAMQYNGIKRLVCNSTLGIGDSKSNLNFFWKYIMFGLLLKQAYADHEKQETYVRESGLDWVLVRPGAFADGASTGNYKHGFGPDEKGLKLKISRADIVQFMIKQLTDDFYLRQAPGLSY